MTWTDPNYTEWEATDYVDDVMLKEQVLDNLVFLKAAVSQMIPIGTIMLTGAAAAPAGFLLCQGQSLLRTDYPSLFSAIGTAFGTVDATHFTLPDLRGRFALGKAASGTGSTLGGTGGSIDHKHTISTHTHTGPSHSHTIPNHVHDLGSTASGGGGGATSSTGSHAHNVGDTDAQGSHAHSFSDSFGTGSNSDGEYVGTGTSDFAAASPHTHSGSISGTTGSGGSHAHNVGDTDAQGTHAHTIPNHVHDKGTNPSNGGGGASSAAGTGNTGGSGTLTSDLDNPPFQAVNYIIRALAI